MKYKNSRIGEKAKTTGGVQCNKLSFADSIEVHGSYYTLAAILFFPSGVSDLHTKMGFIWLKLALCLISFKSTITLKGREREWKRPTREWNNVGGGKGAVILPG